MKIRKLITYGLITGLIFPAISFGQESIDVDNNTNTRTNKVENRMEKMEERQNQMIQKNNERMEKIEEKKDTIRQKVEEKKEEVKEKMEERKAEISERVKEKLGKFVDQMLKRFSAATERLEKLAERINSRIIKMEERGIDMTEGKNKLTEALGLINTAKASVSNLENKASEVLAGDIRALYPELKEMASITKESIKEAHSALVDVMSIIKKTSESINNTEDSDSTN